MASENTRYKQQDLTVVVSNCNIKLYSLSVCNLEQNSKINYIKLIIIDVKFCESVMHLNFRIFDVKYITQNRVY